MNKTATIIIALVLLVAMAAGGFYAGTVYAQQDATTTGAAQLAGGQMPNADGDFSQFRPEGRPEGGRAGEMAGQTDAPGGGMFGEIAEIDGNTFIVTTRDGNQLTVLVTDTTLIEKYASVTAADLEVGETIVISGSADEDGAITARSLQVANAGRMGGLGQAVDEGAQ